MSLKFQVVPEALSLGVKIVTAQIIGVKNSTLNTDFEAYKISELEKIKATWSGKDYKTDPVLVGFRELHAKVGRSNRDYVASPEALCRLFLERGRFPKINTAVDIYNLVSLKTGLALGAHDIDKIEGNVTLRLTKGDEKFIPLGRTDPISIFYGEYGYIDDGNNVICRMEVLQMEPTKIVESTSNIFMIIQGNGNTSDDMVRNTAMEVCGLITQYCGGEFALLI